MSRTRDGVTATYIGSQYEAGTRCLVLSDEGAYSHVKFITGSLAGVIEPISNTALAFDSPTRPPSVFSDDEFGFEYTPRLVSIACREVYEGGGLRALTASLEHSAYIDGLRITVVEAIETLRNVVASNPMWSEVASDIGPEGQTVVAELVNAVVREVIGDSHAA